MNFRESPSLQDVRQRVFLGLAASRMQDLGVGVDRRQALPISQVGEWNVPGKSLHQTFGFAHALHGQGGLTPLSPRTFWNCEIRLASTKARVIIFPPVPELYENSCGSSSWFT